MNIGIYGGSFNPVHFGHVNVARKAIEELSLDRLVVVPANVSPFKADGAADAPRFPWNRLEMVKNAFSAMDKVVVDEREIARGGVSYAIDTVRAIAEENPGAKLFFVVGEDSVEGLSRWKDYDELAKLVEFRAFPRTKESSTEIRRLFEEGGAVLNSEEKVVKVVKDGLRRKEGFCPCRLPKLPEFFCPCDEFKAQLADASYHGLCHCRLYLKP
jgi:nicotinate (nicotinamide) nucleotide adenylyltransferase